MVRGRVVAGHETGELRTRVAPLDGIVPVDTAYRVIRSPAAARGIEYVSVGGGPVVHVGPQSGRNRMPIDVERVHLDLLGLSGRSQVGGNPLVHSRANERHAVRGVQALGTQDAVVDIAVRRRLQGDRRQAVGSNQTGCRQPGGRVQVRAELYYRNALPEAVRPHDRVGAGKGNDPRRLVATGTHEAKQPAADYQHPALDDALPGRKFSLSAHPTVQQKVVC